MADLEAVITDSLNDVTIDDTSDISVDTSSDDVSTDTSSVEASSETPTETAQDASETTQDASTGYDTTAPGNAPTEPSSDPKDPFEELAGVPKVGIGGRENRIPYSRVQKITERAVSNAIETALGRKLNPGEKGVDAIKTTLARVPELEAKTSDYESRLEKVGQFEQVMANDPDRFLQMLERLPAYKEFFSFVRNALQGGGTPEQGAQAQAQPTQVDDLAEMPQPDEELPDGSRVYSMEGLNKMLAWRDSRVASQVRKELAQEFEKRYSPMESEWQERRRIEMARPIIQRQMAEARTWHLFNESENEILDVLRANPTMQLAEAYQKVVFPKLVADRTKIREQVLQEIQTAPRAPAMQSRTNVKPQATTPSTGPRSIEDIIKESVETLKR